MILAVALLEMGALGGYFSRPMFERSLGYPATAAEFSTYKAKVDAAVDGAINYIDECRAVNAYLYEGLQTAEGMNFLLYASLDLCADENQTLEREMSNLADELWLCEHPGNGVAQH